MLWVPAFTSTTPDLVTVTLAVLLLLWQAVDSCLPLQAPL